ncbi:ABC transporter ATP-binding protein [Scandinavium manionii]|uniref:ABC transporter ATP-binding protein n=1 Tax=Scandinavium manionii TaxID=2926520 RepID=UPI001358F4FF|nr:ATP-binding cassette domain-containing protein [Scandinavium manionii]MCS2150438.1 ATP-binding cassette domain-containing protein [Scandinavium manionii]MCS2166664.1 ATP-binding cassette domain-containing protein [Scandinavium manionii]
MLSLRAVNHYYGSQHILWNLSLDLAPGECTCVLGLPGMGKTTLVNCIAGFQAIESGTMVWQDVSGPPRDLLMLSPPLRAAMGIGYVSQDKRIFSQMTVEENLQIAMKAGHEGTGAIGSDIFDLMPDLYPLRHVKGALMSDDDQYQLALASALVTKPKLLILDEPTRGMGQGFMHTLGECLLRLNRDLGLTVLLAEQHLPFIRRVADKFCLLHRGRNVAQGAVNQLDTRLLEQFMTPEEAP